jgi:hypothetical protein
MKEYPTIEKVILDGNNFFVFDKLDGSNVRCEFSLNKKKKRGFSKFGSRTKLFDENTNDLGKYSIPLIKNLEEAIIEILVDNKKLFPTESGTCFFEFFGPSSFGGNHDWNEPHKVVLIDVWADKKGMLDPKDFISLFDNNAMVSIPKVLHYGSITQDLINLVKTSNLEGMSFEGVIGKAKKPQSQHYPPMLKIKSQAWLDKLRSECLTEEEFEKRQ